MTKFSQFPQLTVSVLVAAVHPSLLALAVVALAVRPLDDAGRAAGRLAVPVAVPVAAQGGGWQGEQRQGKEEDGGEGEEEGGGGGRGVEGTRHHRCCSCWLRRDLDRRTCHAESYTTYVYVGTYCTYHVCCCGAAEKLSVDRTTVKPRKRLEH